MNLTKLFLSLLLVAVVAISCKKDEVKSTYARNTITDLVIRNSSLVILKTAVVKAELEATLKSAGPFTVFAPNDEAFTKSGISVASTPNAELKNILLYHTIPGEILSADIANGTNVKQIQANGDSVFVTKNASGIYINGAKVTVADIKADNGIVHILGGALIPASGSILQTIQTTIGGVNGLDSLAKALQLLQIAEPANPYNSKLNTSNLITFFAPTNAALNAQFDNQPVANYNLTALKNILDYQFVAGRNFANNLEGVNTALTFQPFHVNVSATTSGSGYEVVNSKKPTAKIKIAKANVLCRNGVMHLTESTMLFVPTKTIWQTIQSLTGGDNGLDSAYKTLQYFQTTQPTNGIVSKLNAPNIITFFVPTNNALRQYFPNKAVPEYGYGDVNYSFGFSLLAGNKFITDLLNVNTPTLLSSGNTVKVITSATSTSGYSLTTSDGFSYRVNRIFKTDIECTNGMLHISDDFIY